jgi:hypothetical protein
MQRPPSPQQADPSVTLSSCGGLPPGTLAGEFPARPAPSRGHSRGTPAWSTGFRLHVALPAHEQARLPGAWEQQAEAVGGQGRCSLAQAGRFALFDTDVLRLKARQAGYSLAVCRDLFVHPFGTRTFAHGAPAETTREKAT